MANEQPNELAADLRMVITRLIKKLRTKSEAGAKLSLTERSTIKLLDEHKELLPSELAAMEKITTQSMSQILKKLEGHGIIKRSPSKDDKRKVYISLSVTGKKMLEKVRYDKDEWLKGAIEKLLTDKEKDLLVRALPVLNKLI